MTLFNQLIKDTYKDVLHVNQAGAGLPSHDGAEILPVVDDGVGGVDAVLGRLAIQDWLNPAPAAASFAETREWSLTGDMTQGELVTDGWTFNTGMAGEVRGGRLVLDHTPDQSLDFIGAYLTVNFTGDFDIVVCNHGFGHMEVGKRATRQIHGGVMVARSGTNICHGISAGQTTSRTRVESWVGQVYPAAALTVSGENMYHDLRNLALRICRYSGTIYVAVGTEYSPGSNDSVSVLDAPVDEFGWDQRQSVADANTLDRLYLGIFHSGGTNEGGRVQFPFLRRFK